MAVKIFICYAHEDEALLNTLKTHLRPLEREGIIELWHDRDINAGTEWEKAIDEQLNTAQVVLLLVSPDFMASDYCYSKEMRRAMERHERGEAIVIPIILRPAMWQQAPFSKLQALPRDGKPVKNWSAIDDAFYDVTKSLRKILQEDMSLSPPHPGGIQPTSKVPRRAPKPLWLSGLLLLILGVVGFSFLSAIRQQIDTITPQTSATATTQAQHAAATAFANTPQGIYIQATRGTPVLSDPLRDNSQNYQWGVASYCYFSEGVYHVTVNASGLRYCNGAATNFRNLAYQVQISVVQGDAGCLLFRFTLIPGNSKYYAFCVSIYGAYELYVVDPHANNIDGLQSGVSSTIKTGLNQVNTLTIIAQGATFTSYVNGQYIFTARDSTYTQGAVGMGALDQSHPTDVAFWNAKVWIL